MSRSIRILFFLVLFFVLLVAAGARAGELTHEKNLRQDFKKSQVLLEEIDQALRAGKSYQDSLSQLKELGEAIRSEHQALLAQFADREEQLDALGATAAARQAAVRESYDQAISRYLAALDAVDGTQVTTDEITKLEQIIDDIIPERKRHILGTTPYRHLNLPARPPQTAPLITPAYKGGDGDFAGADLEESPEAPISLAIAERAEALHWNPVEMYEWVKNNVKTEWYWGAMKGAEETLRQMSGNDADQASLLVALFRAAGFPARYVRGIIEFFPDLDAARAQNGLEDALDIGRLLQRAGIPCESVIAGGRDRQFQSRAYLGRGADPLRLGRPKTVLLR